MMLYRFLCWIGLHPETETLPCTNLFGTPMDVPLCLHCKKIRVFGKWRSLD